MCSGEGTSVRNTVYTQNIHNLFTRSHTSEEKIALEIEAMDHGIFDQCNISS
jgi:hypothetical protein